MATAKPTRVCMYEPDDTFYERPHIVASFPSQRKAIAYMKRERSRMQYTIGMLVRGNVRDTLWFNYSLLNPGYVLRLEQE